LNGLIVAAWGMLAAQFSIQACLFLVMFVFAVTGFITGSEKVPRSNNAAAMAATSSGVAVFLVLLVVGSSLVGYLQLDPLHSIVFWVGVAISVAYIAPQIPAKLKSGWRDAMQEDAMLRRAFENAKNWPPKRSPEMTPATYRVVFSDGKCQDTDLLPKEIDRWATKSNRDAEGKFQWRIVRIIDQAGNTVWGK
jgi:hypothetical protein